jgi:DNA-directed RNA polymerase subunit RPC12/RpoP
MFSKTEPFACPNCGAELSARLRSTKVVACSYCDSNVLLEDDAVRLAGKQGVMADYPSLLALQQSFRYRGWDFMPIGIARFDYGQGYWDEWWITSGDGEGHWLSVDEGDFALEEPIEIDETPSAFELVPGRAIRLDGHELYVTEQGRATCIGIKGELPEALNVGDSYTYFHLSGAGGLLYTLEIDRGRAACHKGRWIDPFGIESL